MKGVNNNLNNNDIVINILPTGPFNTELIPWMLVSPDPPYNRAHPNKNNPEEIAPKTKYFNPASVP